MPFKDFDVPIHEAWATWEVLRKLGFVADDIFWEIAVTPNATPGPGLALNVVLRTQGKQFAVTCSRTMSEDEAQVMLQSAKDFQAHLSAGLFAPDEMTERLHVSFAWVRQADLILTLRTKGIELPFKNQARREKDKQAMARDRVAAEAKRLTASQSFSPEEVTLLAALFNALLAGGDARVMMRSEAGKNLMRKTNAMKASIERQQLAQVTGTIEGEKR